MGKIFCLMGKSASGKDTVFRELLREPSLMLSTITPYTTRPIRDGEKNGEAYYFCSEEKLAQLERMNKVIELREYHTVHGIWKYFTPDDGQIKLQHHDYLVIGTLESYEKMQQYFGKEFLIPIYMETEDGLRLDRALKRERKQKNPKYAEMCRRFLADEKDFALEKRKAAEIGRVFQNADIRETIQEIINYIKEELYK